MKYSVTTREATIAADEFIGRYRDVPKFDACCRQCHGYGQSWGCPPFDFDPAGVTDGFTTVKVMGTIIEFDDQTRAACETPQQTVDVGKQAIDEVWQTLLPRLYEMERELPGSRCFTFRCALCPQGCTRPQGLPCRHPDRLRYSLESVGFDVVAITRDLLGIDLEWSRDGSLSRRITLVTALFHSL